MPDVTEFYGGNRTIIILSKEFSGAAVAVVSVRWPGCAVRRHWRSRC